MPTQELNRKFGIELEFASRAGIRAAGTAIEQAGLELTNQNGWAGHQHENADWQLKTDSTAGLELISRVLQGEAGLREVREKVAIMDGLQDDASLGFRITSHCGFHVHIDTSDFSWKELQSLVKMVLKYEDVIFGMQPASRTSSSYTRSVRNDEYSALASTKSERTFQRILARLDRCHGLNLINFLTQGTIEFRYAAGTLNADKVTAWITFLIGLVETAKAKRVSAKVGGRKFSHLRGDALFNLNILSQYKGWGEGLKAAKALLVKRFNKFSGRRANETIRYAG